MFFFFCFSVFKWFDLYMVRLLLYCCYWVDNKILFVQVLNNNNISFYYMMSIINSFGNLITFDTKKFNVHLTLPTITMKTIILLCFHVRQQFGACLMMVEVVTLMMMIYDICCYYCWRLHFWHIALICSDIVNVCLYCSHFNNWMYSVVYHIHQSISGGDAQECSHTIPIGFVQIKHTHILYI